MAEATGLRHIKDDQVSESFFQSFSNSFSVGPLKINYTVDLAIQQVTFQVYLVGIQIGSATINPQHPCATVGGGALGLKAEATLCIDPPKKKVTYDVEVCAPFSGCRKWAGTLFSWP
ncbi:MAG TPA: hypothetical protein VMW27_12025 [Thermoanaerobaculia bacterium]|nr:hypothetical protein [Thermoanaerobaculia bacterium]